MALTGITMFRSREGADDLDELIPNRDEPGRFRVEDFRLADGGIALVHYNRTPVRPPKWASFFRNIIDPDELRSQSSSAVVAFERNGHWYLVTFGYGRYLINPDLIEPSFGLRVTLNGVDPEKIRSVDRKRVDAVSRLTREQLSKDSRMGAFGLDVHQDLLSAVTGVPTNEELGTRLYGKDAVGLRVEASPRDLGQIADRLEELFSQEAYKQQFRWVDNIAEVGGAAETAALDRALVQAVVHQNEQEIDLAPPELIDWSRAHGFIYRRGAEPEIELSLRKYFELVRSSDEVNMEALKGDRVQLIDTDGNRMGGWSIYRCLSGEIVRDGVLYVISDGSWYKVDRDFLHEVDNAVAEMEEDAVQLPPYLDRDEDEAGYNLRVADQSDGALVCMDQKYIWPRSWQDRIEFCDLYRADRTMIHVKRYSGGSATLSHLFAQGSVSVRCLLTDRPFVSDVDRELPPSHRFGEAAPDARTCHVVYAIVSEPGREFSLPFFSRVALRNSADLIRSLGARVSFQAIENHAAA